MPYAHEIRNRLRMKRAVLTAAVLAGLLLLMLAPSRILGWSGFGFGSLTVPEATVAALDEPVAATPQATVRTPPIVQPLTFPAYAEWSDLEEACADCDWSISYGGGGELDAVDDGLLSRLEHSSGLGSAGNAGPAYGNPSRSSSSGGGFGGGGVGGGGVGGGSGAGGAAGTTDEAQAENTSASESTSEAEPAEATAAEAIGGSAGGGGGSSDSSDPSGSGGSSGSGSAESSSSGNSGTSGGSGSSPGNGASASAEGPSGESSGPQATSTATGLAASETPDLILSPIAPDGDNQGGGTIPQDLVLALIESPVGAETVHSAGQPEVISARLNLEAPEASAGDAEDQDQEEAIPEPSSLLLVGLGLAAGMSRLRQVRAR